MKTPTVALVLYPDFSLFHFSIPYKIFSTIIDQKKLFDIKIISTEDISRQTHHELSIHPHGGLELIPECDVIILFGGNNQSRPPQKLLDTLKKAYSQKAILVGLCYGAYILAYSGILDGKKATTHWLAHVDFSMRFPKVKLEKNTIYIEQDNVITSAGTVASLDCCLSIVRNYYGVEIASNIAKILIMPTHREGLQPQFIPQPVSKKNKNFNINQLINIIRQNICQDYSINQLASQLAMSRKTFTRHFHNITGQSFTHWLIDTRLAYAKNLLETTDLNIETVSLQSGFKSSTSMRQHFIKKYNVTPKQWRFRFKS
ncbi:helix-turn-helix domain-containing protein [Pasteurellaceae bacterium HPA106]|uniref:GlxA family transcriptional regulator n=1 Tax=Spirabiliibacterium pneumoniae TaxID=221400 RepID=UPI001AADCEF1|nr:helix-turn-helix domain-containing protein [Spirabiliibacterium pneumoniae]MBE2895344.1 helix-turn-helix domain-containing protein [Spirabiliibacterium pneumoniae]